MTLPRAVIIAGGEGQRLGGVRKGDLRVGGVRLIERVAMALGAVERPLLVSTGPAGRAGVALDGSLGVADFDSECGGPLAGLAAAVAALRAQGIADGLLVSVAVDTPFLPADFVARMIGALGDAPAAYAAWGEDFYPPNAVWQLAAVADLPEMLAGGRAPQSLKALQRGLGARRVEWRDWETANPFVNLNTVADLVALGRRVKGALPV